MSANNTTKLQTLESALKARGVVDVKFFFDHAMKPMTGVVEEVQEMLNAMLEDRFDKASPLGNAC